MLVDGQISGLDVPVFVLFAVYLLVEVTLGDKILVFLLYLRDLEFLVDLAVKIPTICLLNLLALLYLICNVCF